MERFETKLQLSAVAQKAAFQLGFLSLKDKQKDIIVQFLKGRDVIGVLPTGYGKSLCFIVLPHAFHLLTQVDILQVIIVVVSPLTALIKDQVRNNFI